MPSKRREAPSTSSLGASAERRVRRYYRLRGYRVLDANARGGGNELDIVLRRGQRLVFAEVKARGGSEYGEPLEAIDREKVRRVERAAESWLLRHPELAGLEIAFEAVAVRRGRIERSAFS